MNHKAKGILCCLAAAILAVSSSSAVMAEPALEAETETVTYEITCSKDDVVCENIYFDYTEEIAQQKEATVLIPEAAAIELTVSDESGTSGVILTAAEDEEAVSDYYLNAYAAGHTLDFNGQIKSAVSSVNGELEVAEGSVSYVPAAISAKEMEDEVIDFTMEDGTVYHVHTVPEAFLVFEVTGSGVSEENAGVYTYSLDRFLVRVSTDGEIVYYRNLQCVEEALIENFAPQNTGEKQYYSVFMELNRDFRNAAGGFSSGMYLLMDENYTDIDEITLYPNEEANHTHGEGYLDQHEFVILEDGHYLLLSYTRLAVGNLPESLEGIDGTRNTYVWAGIMQEVKDGKVIAEINTADYPLIYESAVERIDYAGATLEEVMFPMGADLIPSLSDGTMDYVHVNSLDYTLAEDGTVDKLLVSMRDQCAVFQFDMKSGAIDWILGGKASTLTGYDEFTSERKDDNGAAFNALTYAQHFARYTNRSENGTIERNAIISVFDNSTGVAPFISVMDPPTRTRVLKAEIDEEAGTAKVFDVIEGSYLNEKSGKYHLSSHCGSVQYVNENSVVIGWGCHGVVDNLGPLAPEGTLSDVGFDDLRQGSKPVFTEYDMENDEVTFELTNTRSPKSTETEPFFAYRAYKTAK